MKKVRYKSSFLEPENYFKMTDRHIESPCQRLKTLGFAQGWIQEFFVGGANLKKLEKMTSAAVGRTEN